MCPFCKYEPCNMPSCPYTQIIKTIKAHIKDTNHSAYEDRLRMIQHVKDLQNAQINRSQKDRAPK